MIRLTIEDLESDSSLVLCQGTPLIMNGMRPVPPNIVYCGMMQCREPQPLPPDLQQFMDAATEGVVYVSFGSVLQGSQVPQDKKEALMKVFGSLKQKVLMKWETERMEDQPSNLTLKKFLPQQDILGHHNCVAFITHAGYLSFEESLCHRVPMLATPICYDQFDNAAEIESLGVGRSVKFTDITENNLKQALVEVNINFEGKNRALSCRLLRLPVKLCKTFYLIFTVFTWDQGENSTDNVSSLLIN